MFETIVVGVAPTDSAQRAAEQALELAERLGARLHLVCAYEGEPTEPLSSVIGETALAKGGQPLAAAPRRSDGRLHAEQFLGSVAGRAAVPTRTHALPGDAAEAILQVCEEVHADLVVVGNRGMRGARRVLGSVPNTVSHRAPCSVLIVNTTG